MRTPRKAQSGPKKKSVTGPTDPSNEGSGLEHNGTGQPKVTSYLLEMDLRAIKAHLRHILSRFKGEKKGK